MTQRRSVIFLQGPQTPFGDRLRDAFAKSQHSITKVIFSGGDVFFWPHRDAKWFTGNKADWPAWFERLIVETGATDVLLFGDCRPPHKVALDIAKARGLRRFVLEEGYFRPGWITLEKNGTNGYSELPKDRETCLALGEALSMPKPDPFPYAMKTRVLYAIWHHVGNFFMFPAFYRFRTHRPYPIGYELIGWLPRWRRMKSDAEKAKALQSDLSVRGVPFFLYPLQLSSDFQVTVHSPFNNTIESIDAVMESFAANADGGAHLVIKCHPVDNGLIDFKAHVVKRAEALKIEKRVHFMDGGDLEKLCKDALGVVLVNSTVGMTSLALGAATKNLGVAIYDIPGLTDQKDLDDFWIAPDKPDPILFDAFLRLVLNRTQVNGNFYTEEGIASAIQGLMQRMNLSDDGEQDVRQA